MTQRSTTLAATLLLAVGLAALAYVLPDGLPETLAEIGAGFLGVVVAPLLGLLAVCEWLAPIREEPARRDAARESPTALLDGSRRAPGRRPGRRPRRAA